MVGKSHSMIMGVCATRIWILSPSLVQSEGSKLFVPLSEEIDQQGNIADHIHDQYAVPA